MNKNTKLYFLFIGCLLILLFKLWIGLENFGFLRFSSDTQRQLLVFQEIQHLESIPNYRIFHYLQYSDELVLVDTGFYSRGGHMVWVVLHKLTGLESFHLMNVATLFLVVMCMGAVAILTRLFYKKMTVVALAVGIFLSGLIVFNTTSHYFAAYVFFPLLIWGALKYLETDNKKYLILWSIFWAFLQTLHSNYATMFLLILTAYVLGEEWKNRKNLKIRHQLHTLFLVGLTIYVAHLSYYYEFTQENIENFRAFFSEYSGIWSLTYFSNPFDGLLLYGLIGCGYLYSVLHWISLHKRRKQYAPESTKEPEGAFDLRLSPSRFFWLLWLFLLTLPIVSPTLLYEGIQGLWGANNNLARLENFPLLALFFLSLFSVKESFDKAHRLLVWLYIPIFVLVFGSAILVIPFLRELGNPLVVMSFPIIDFSFPLLCIVGAHILYEKIKPLSMLKRSLVVALLLTSFMTISLEGMYLQEYKRDNSDLSFIQAYQTLLPLEEETRVGSNYPYLKSLRYLEEGLIVQRSTVRELSRVNLNEEILKQDMDYFILYKWINIFPEEKWMQELNQNPNIKMIYDKDAVKIFQIMEGS